MAREIPRRYKDQDVAYCGKCKQWKPKHDFHKDSSRISGVTGHCKVCKAEWRAANADYLRQRASEWQRNNPERAAANARNWRENNPEKVREHQERNKERQRARWPRKYTPEALERRLKQRREYAAQYEKRFPEKTKALRHKRRARIIGNGGTYTAEEWRALCAKYDHRCLRCGEQKPLSVDHVIPLVLGGTNTIDNLQPLCVNCNSQKGRRAIDYRQSTP